MGVLEPELEVRERRRRSKRFHRVVWETLGGKEAQESSGCGELG
jgi:hypothetical protein